MPAAAVHNILNSKKSILNISFEAESQPNSSNFQLISNSKNDSDDSAAVNLAISQTAYKLQKQAYSLRTSNPIADISTEVFSNSNFETENFQREIVQTVSDIMNPYRSEKEARDAITEQKIELETANGEKEVKGLAYKLAYELNSYLLSFGKDNSFFPRLQTAIDNSQKKSSQDPDKDEPVQEVEMNAIVRKIKSMIRDVQNGNLINIDSVDLKLEFNAAIRSTFEQTSDKKPKIQVDDLPTDKMDEFFKNDDSKYLDSLKESAKMDFDDEILRSLFADKNEDASENEKVNAGKEILKKILLLRESMDYVDEIIERIKFKDKLRHMDDENESLPAENFQYTSKI